MNPSNQVVNTNEVIKPNEDWLRSVPAELAATVPDSVWMTLSLEAKKDLLRQNGLLEKYENLQAPTTEEIATQEVQIAEAPKQEVVVLEEQRVQRSPEFAKAVEALKEVDAEKKDSKEDKNAVMSKEEIARVEAETAQSASIKTYKFFGYQPSTTTFSTAKQISTTGNIDDSRTWAATLISKIFSLFE